MVKYSYCVLNSQFVVQNHDVFKRHFDYANFLANAQYLRNCKNICCHVRASAIVQFVIVLLLKFADVEDINRSDEEIDNQAASGLKLLSDSDNDDEMVCL